MSYLERLDEALKRCDAKSGNVYVVTDPDVIAVFHAARAYRDLLANGQRVEWCEEHRSAGNDETCAFGRVLDRWQDCRIVSKLLIDPPTEEEKSEMCCCETDPSGLL